MPDYVNPDVDEWRIFDTIFHDTLPFLPPNHVGFASFLIFAAPVGHPFCRRVAGMFRPVQRSPGCRASGALAALLCCGGWSFVRGSLFPQTWHTRIYHLGRTGGGLGRRRILVQAAGEKSRCGQPERSFHGAGQLFACKNPRPDILRFGISFRPLRCRCLDTSRTASGKCADCRRSFRNGRRK